VETNGAGEGLSGKKWGRCRRFFPVKMPLVGDQAAHQGAAESSGVNLLQGLALQHITSYQREAAAFEFEFVFMGIRLKPDIFEPSREQAFC
jgi:hypothetical protein